MKVSISKEIKKALCLVLVLLAVISLSSCASSTTVTNASMTTYLNSHGRSFKLSSVTTPKGSTVQTCTYKEEVKSLFPGLKEVESRDVDRSLPIIEVNSVDELAAIINSLNSAFLYKNQPVNERRPKYYNGKGAMVYDMFPGLTVVDSDCEPGFYQRSEILFAFVFGISRELRKTRNIIILLHDPE